jgi:dolichyl-diphosphooligosaccharide---protein glycosyltransferase
MQVTSVFIKNHILPTMSINDICVFVPAWFGVTATLAVAWLTYECTRNNTSYGSILNQVPGIKQVHRYIAKPVVAAVFHGLDAVVGSDLGLSSRTRPSPWVAPACAVAAAAVMSVVPAHLLRSVGGGYDNESIAMTAMVLTFACWCFSLRDDASILQTTLAGALTGLAYFYMVAAWGGYVFVLNVIAVHAGFLVLIGRYSTKLHRAYSAFYVVGTALAIQVPVVGLTPLKSIEQLGALAAFGGLQLIEICEIQRRRKNMTRMQAWQFRALVFAAAGAAAVVIVALLMPTGYFGPISSRVRGLFVKHTKTGNPLVDSVAEHQAASPQAYFQYLNELCYLSPVALAATALCFFNDSSSFLVVYGMSAYFFSHKMIRLILLTAPIASALGGIFLGRCAVWMLNSAFDLVDYFTTSKNENDLREESEREGSVMDVSKNGDKSTKKKSAKKSKPSEKKEPTTEAAKSHPLLPIVMLARIALSGYVAYRSMPYFRSFHRQAHAIAKQISHPTIISKAQMSNGEIGIVDDYREAYYWLRDNTPEDARIMAWWDCT